MQLTLEVHKVKNIKFGVQTALVDNILFVNKGELINEVEDPIFTYIDVELARPGESTRIIPVKDVIEPRIKSNGEFFPGILGKFQGYGEGTTKVLRGCVVSTTGQIVGFQEGLIDMSGPATSYSHYSKLNHIVLIADVKEGTHPAKHERALRMAGLKAARYLALSVKELAPDKLEKYELKRVKGLPRIAIIYLLICQGLLHDNYFYGVDVKNIHPTLVHPNEIMDGAVVSGNCVVAADKNTTYDHLNNQLIKELYARHGVDLNFAGVILTPVCVNLADKERCCNSAINIARSLGVDGIVVPEEGSGNPEADLMMICRMAEKKNIKSVLIIGPDGDEECITDTTPEADAVINLGGGKQRLHLPKMDKVIGYQNEAKYLSGGIRDYLCEDGGIAVTIAAIMGSKNGLGFTKMSSTIY